MRHKKRGKKLNRTGAHRKALMRNLAISLIEHESIKTTPQKAKFVQPFIEKLVTLAKKIPELEKNSKTKAKALHYRRRILSMLYRAFVDDPEREGKKKTAVNKLIENIAPRYVDRAGGYTRIIRLPKRRLGDNAELCLLQFVDAEIRKPKKVEEKAEKEEEKSSSKEVKEASAKEE